MPSQKDPRGKIKPESGLAQLVIRIVGATKFPLTEERLKRRIRSFHPTYGSWHLLRRMVDQGYLFLSDESEYTLTSMGKDALNSSYFVIESGPNASEKLYSVIPPLEDPAFERVITRNLPFFTESKPKPTQEPDAIDDWLRELLSAG